MSKLSRYLFIKKMYPDYLVFILNKDKLVTYNNDLKIYNMLESEFFSKSINYLILDGLEIKELRTFSNNNYFYYFKISLLKEVVKFIKKVKYN